jgi:hypothetical protein
MSVTVRPYVNGGWEVDIRVQLPDGSVIRERKKAAASSKQAAQKWAESRERVLLVHGKPKPAKGGRSEDTDVETVHPAFSRRIRKGEPAEAEWHRVERDGAARASREGVRR